MQGARTASAARASSGTRGGAGRRNVARRLVRNEHVAEPPDGLYVSRCRGVGFNELAQSRDLHVDGAIEHVVIASAREQHELFARQWLAWMRRQHFEQAEFAGGQGYG